MTLIVCGSRDYADRRLIRQTLDRFHARRPVTMRRASTMSAKASFSRPVDVSDHLRPTYSPRSDTSS